MAANRGLKHAASGDLWRFFFPPLIINVAIFQPVKLVHGGDGSQLLDPEVDTEFRKMREINTLKAIRKFSELPSSRLTVTTSASYSSCGRHSFCSRRINVLRFELLNSDATCEPPLIGCFQHSCDSWVKTSTSSADLCSPIILKGFQSTWQQGERMRRGRRRGIKKGSPQSRTNNDELNIAVAAAAVASCAAAIPKIKAGGQTEDGCLPKSRRLGEDRHQLQERTGSLLWGRR